MATADFVLPAEPPGAGLGRAVEYLVTSLPPKERACVLLKDVFDYTLEEIAELVDSTVGGVKAALNRGRSKLAAAAEDRTPPQKKNAELSKLLHLYVERFNRRDWNGLRELIADDARLRVADKFAGRLDDSPYFGNYDRWTVAWRMAVGEVDSEPVIIILHREDGSWTPGGIAHLEVIDGRIRRVADYLHCPWILTAASSVVVETYS